ncbi:polysaccharide deacetylase family protein [Desulfosporosinus sp. OT]|uniref:polysaccharide deacetylase family protein n=1 Tax=Desulfosporosinus sp. OT TaxID=913865 RepID=UPI000223A78F|nr:polysaccharide deacetylase family protein [Desulfosporosinus sp. OT]EGW38441.1 polysaccharide deacetylase family protein [Desulfosporosinus sp. OT]
MSLGYMLLSFVLGLLALYTVIPDLLLHRLGIGSWKRQFSPGVALTFDDGPDPEFTPQVLEVLRKHQVCATFFVVAEKAKEFPELIRRIKDEGHLIGVHSLNHRYAWFASPWRTSQEWTESVRILERLWEDRITWMRPPWGTFNLMTWWWLKRHKMRAVSWNAEGHDWEARRTPEEITERILKDTNEGTIIVLHDSGGEFGARKNSILALERLCEQIVRELKLPIVPLEFPDWKLGKRLTFRVWEKWEHYYAKRHSVERIDAANIFRLEKSMYGGPKLHAEDGQILAEKGDLVAEIHFDNIRLQAKGQDMQQTALKAMHQVRESLPGLARYVAQERTYDNIKVFVAQTLFHRGVKRFGFNVQDLPDTLKNRGIVWLQKMIMRVYHPAGKNRNNERLGNKTMLVWISKEKLERIFEFDYGE